MENYGTIWVCQDCMLHHANGECGGCHDDEQSVDQAFLGIGANLVTGFDVYRYSFKGRDESDVTVVSVHSSSGLVFGAYEFAGIA